MFPSEKVKDVREDRPGVKSASPSRLVHLLPVAVVGAALLLWRMWGGDFQAPADPVVATINNEAVTAAEYRLVMERKTAEVFGYMKQRYDLDDHPGYWSESTGPEGPLAKLREVVLEELVRIKVCQGLAKEKGLVRETSFAAFQEEFQRENARRSEAKRQGQVVYGPAQYRMAAYYYIRFGDLIYKLTQALAKEGEAQIPEAEIVKFYQENKASYDNKPLAEVRQRILEVLSLKEARKQLKALYASASVKVNEKPLRGLVPRVDAGPDS
jgi:hypothetical protein